MNGKLIKVIGIATTLIGMGASFLSNWVENKQLDAKIDKKVNEALSKKDKEEES